MSVRIAVFASGGGTNLQALLDHFGAAPASALGRVALVLSDRERAGALERAQRAGVAVRVVEHGGRAPGDVAREMRAGLEDAGIELIALAGYLRLVPADVVQRYRLRMLNVHPGLLPAFGGKGLYGERVHRAVLDAGCGVSGASVHFVDETYDTGPILAQWPVPVLRGDTVETLAARVLRVEHRLYPPAVELVARALAQGRDPAEFIATDAPSVREPPGPAAFALTDALAPSAEDVRRGLGLD